MHRKMVGFTLLVLFMVGATAGAQDSDLVAGEKLYQKHCGVCHGIVSSSGASHRLPEPLPWSLVRIAMALPSGPTLTDVSGPMAPGMIAPAATRPFIVQLAADDARVAFAPPFGPNLRGVYGRPAGSVKGFAYSRAFKNALQGMVWNRDSLDVWLTNTQAWVPGVRMFYKQPDPEIRRQIIMYLKAHA